MMKTGAMACIRDSIGINVVEQKGAEYKREIMYWKITSGAVHPVNDND